MRRYMGEPECSCVLFYNMPDDSFRYAVAPEFACPTDTPEQSSGRNAGSSRPQVDDSFDPLGHRHSSNVAAFANQINYGPVFFALLQVRESRSANSLRRRPQPSNTARIARSRIPLSVFE